MVDPVARGVHGRCRLPGVGERIVQAARVEEPRVSASPDDHAITSPDRAVTISVLRCTDEARRRPVVGDRIVASARLDADPAVLDSTIAAPDDH